LRFFSNYEIYDLFDVYIPVGFSGDCYDRYLVRLEEMRSSLFIIKESLVLLQVINNSFILEDFKIAPPFRSFLKFSMESLIHHFKFYSEGSLFHLRSLMFSLKLQRVNLVFLFRLLILVEHIGVE